MELIAVNQQSISIGVAWVGIHAYIELAKECIWSFPLNSIEEVE